jgi:hypothetical protein
MTITLQGNIDGSSLVTFSSAAGTRTDQQSSPRAFAFRTCGGEGAGATSANF